MFVLHELEKILQQFAHQSKRTRPREPVKSLLAQIERVDVEQLRLPELVPLQPLDADQVLSGSRCGGPLDISAANSDGSSIDALFAASMSTILLDNLKKLPPRAFPAARLMICDQESYDLLMKFQFVSQKTAADNRPSSFIIYRQPYNVAAVFLLDDIVDQLNRLDRPIVKFSHDPLSNKQMAQYEYSIVKQVFPYLKIADLVVVLRQLGELKLRMYTIDGRRDHQILQFLTHFARGSMLLELRTIESKLGQSHLLFDNVVAFLPHNNELFFDSMSTLEKQAAQLDDTETRFNYNLMPPLKHLTLVAYRLVRLVQQLGWSLESVTFRLGDPNGFTKVFSHILDSVVKYEKKRVAPNSNTATTATKANSFDIIPARVLVLDRFFDFQGLLRHADLYGSFVEQELKSAPGNLVAARRLNALHSLDAQLCFEKLDEVLGTLLSLSAEVRSSSAESSSATRDTQAIQKHLACIKQMYKMMSEGHLLLAKLESRIDSIATKLLGLNAPLEEREQNEIVGRIRRIDVAFRQLLSLKSPSIKVSDALRFACMLIDLINMFLYLGPAELARSQLLELKIALVVGKGLIADIRAIIDARGNDLSNETAAPADTRRQQQKDACAQLSECLDEFDKISSKYCANRSLLRLEKMVEQFYRRQLDASSYTTQKLDTSSGLVPAHSRNKIIVIMLGSLSYDELYRIKLFESSLNRVEPVTGGRKSPMSAPGQSRRKPRKDILTIACGYIRPDEFVQSL